MAEKEREKKAMLRTSYGSNFRDKESYMWQKWMEKRAPADSEATDD